MVKEMRHKSADLERVFFDITHKSSKRVLKGSIGAPIPPKPSMRFRSASRLFAVPHACCFDIALGMLSISCAPVRRPFGAHGRRD